MKNWLKAHKGFAILVLSLLLLRTAVADWNPIPSGSMRPQLVEGDVVLVNRLAYHLKLPLTDVLVARLGEPQRGDVVTFFSPGDGTRLIKRVIGVPGDTVEMRNGRAVVNGHVIEAIEQTSLQVPALASSHRVDSTPDAAAATFAPVVVPADHFLLLGDNRLASQDFRHFGMVPRKNLIGRAERVLISTDFTSSWLPRMNRFGLEIR